MFVSFTKDSWFPLLVWGSRLQTCITFAVKSKSHIGRLEWLLLPWLPARGTRTKQSRCVYIATATVNHHQQRTKVTSYLWRDGGTGGFTYLDTLKVNSYLAVKLVIYTRQFQKPKRHLNLTKNEVYKVTKYCHIHPNMD